jgi:hypothetical protein
MQMATKITIVMSVLITVMTSSCTGSVGQQTPTNGSSGTGTTGSGTGTTGSGTGTTGSGTGTTGSGSQHTSTTSESPHVNNSNATQPATNNGVVLGGDFSGSLDFGKVPVGGSTQRQIGVGNGSGQAVRVITISIVGSEFVLAGDACTNVVLQNGDSCTISIKFTPQANGVRRAELSVIPNQGLPGSADLKGVGGFPNPGQSNHSYQSQPVELGGSQTTSSGTPTPSPESS